MIGFFFEYVLFFEGWFCNVCVIINFDGMIGSCEVVAECFFGDILYDYVLFGMVNFYSYVF